MASTKITILLIEDDIDDVELLQEALANNLTDYAMKVIMEGDRVAPYLDNYEVLPDVIVMDLNLPKTDGREIMKYIKASAVFGAIPLVVLSTSSAREDIDYAYNMGAKTFVTKPITMDGWNAVGVTITEQVQI